MNNRNFFVTHLIQNESEKPEWEQINDLRIAAEGTL